jgi:hypothetical protein
MLIAEFGHHFAFQGIVLSVESFYPEVCLTLERWHDLLPCPRVGFTHCLLKGSGIFPHGRRINNWSGAEVHLPKKKN